MSRIYGVLALIANWYFISAVCGALVATSCAIAQRALTPLASLVIAPLLLITATLYQLRSSRVRWLSPGEEIVGRSLDGEGKKHWGNPWHMNRAALVLVILPAMVFSGNAWDGVFEERLYPAGKIVTNAILLVVLWGGFVLTGRGATSGILVVVGYYCLLGATLALAPALAKQSPVEFNRILGYALLGCGVVSTVIAGVYHQRRRSHALAAPHESGVST